MRVMNDNMSVMTVILHFAALRIYCCFSRKTR